MVLFRKFALEASTCIRVQYLLGKKIVCSCVTLTTATALKEVCLLLVSEVTAPVAIRLIRMLYDATGSQSPAHQTKLFVSPGVQSNSLQAGKARLKQDKFEGCSGLKIQIHLTGNYLQFKQGKTKHLNGRTFLP